MSGLDHEQSAILDEAQRWLRQNRRTCDRPLLPALRRRFGLNLADAVSVIRAVNGAAKTGGADAGS